MALKLTFGLCAKARLFSDPGEQGIRFGKSIFSWAATKKKGNRVPLNN